jgi:hypothetical protein
MKLLRDTWLEQGEGKPSPSGPPPSFPDVPGTFGPSLRVSARHLENPGRRTQAQGEAHAYNDPGIHLMGSKLA